MGTTSSASVQEIVIAVGTDAPTFHEDGAAVLVPNNPHSSWRGAMFLCDGGIAVGKFGYQRHCGNEPFHNWGLWMTARWHKVGLEWSLQTHRRQPDGFQRRTVAWLMCTQHHRLGAHVNDLILNEASVLLSAGAIPPWIGSWIEAQDSVGVVSVEEVRVCATYHDAKQKEVTGTDFILAHNQSSAQLVVASYTGGPVWFQDHFMLERMQPSPTTWIEAHQHEALNGVDEMLSNQAGFVNRLIHKALFA